MNAQEQQRPISGRGSSLVCVFGQQRESGSSFANRHAMQLERAVCLGQCVGIEDPLSRLLETIAERSVIFDKIAPREWRIVRLAIALAKIQGRWIRDPHQWCPSHPSEPFKQARSLVHHLLVRYDIPSYFDSAWRSDAGSLRDKLGWFCHVAQGSNISTAEGFPALLSKAAGHQMMGAPAWCSVLGAARWGQVLASGGSKALARAIARSPIRRCGFDRDDVWLRLFEILAVGVRVDRATLSRLIRYLWHRMYVEPDGITYSLKGRTLQSLEVAERSWRAQFVQALRYGIDFDEKTSVSELQERVGLFGRSQCWRKRRDIEPMKLGVSSDGDRHLWQIRELVSAKALIDEGYTMRHCVGDYAEDCQTGNSSIWTLSGPDASGARKTLATIEVSRVPLRIVQAQAKFNLRPCPESRWVIDRWALLNNIDARVIHRWD